MNSCIIVTIAGMADAQIQDTDLRMVVVLGDSIMHIQVFKGRCDR